MDGVYFPDGVPNFFKKLETKFNLKHKDIYAWYGSEEMDNYKRDLLTKDQFWNFTIKHFQIKSTPDELIKLLLDSYSVDQRIVKMLNSLNGKYQRVIYTNNFRERFENLEKMFNVKKDFDIILLSYEVGEIKPNEKMTQALLNQTQCKKEEILIIDDGENNVKKLAKQGFQTILYKNYNQLVEELKKKQILK